MNLQKTPILIIGSGAVGLTVASHLKNRRIPLLGVTTRQKKKVHQIGKQLGIPCFLDYLPLLSKAKLILFAVSDEALIPVAKRVHESGFLAKNAVLGHFSGAFASSLLKTRTHKSAFSLHPLQTFASMKPDPTLLQGIPMIGEGSSAGLNAARQLADLFGGIFVKVNEKNKALYHAAACTASNFIVTLASTASFLNQKAGISPKHSLSILLPILRTSIANLDKVGLPNALTGPIARGDTQTVRRHLNALKQTSPEMLCFYLHLSLHTLDVAMAKGLSREKGEELGQLLTSWLK